MPPALKLYARHGFRRVGERTGYYTRPDGSSGDGPDHDGGAVVIRRALIDGEPPMTRLATVGRLGSSCCAPGLPGDRRAAPPQPAPGAGTGRGLDARCYFHRLFVAALLRCASPRAARRRSLGEPALVLVQPHLLARHHRARLPAAALLRGEIGDRRLAGRSGTLARLQRTVFIDRARRADDGERQRHGGRAASTGGDLIVLFAEGTTGDGTRLLPFRSSLVGAARAALDSARAAVRDRDPAAAPGDHLSAP